MLTTVDVKGVQVTADQIGHFAVHPAIMRNTETSEFFLCADTWVILDELIEQLAAEHGWQIVAHEVLPDHVHLFLRVGPTDAPAAVVRAFKGRTARVLRAEFPHLRRFAKVLWSPAYFAASVGYVSETTVRRYIEHQWDAVLAS
jgi:REP-associated tyrosine transposase